MRDQSQDKACPQCRTPNSTSSLFCSHCGARLDESGTLSYSSDATETSKPADRLNFPPGALFAGRYLIVEELGHGAMGRVFKAKDKRLGITVALKILRPEYSANMAAADRFKQETLLTRSLVQENVIRIFDLGESEGLTFISMEFVPGQSLGQLIRASGMLTEETVVSIARQIVFALTAAHGHGIIHRDLKPQNILVDAEGQVHVADFGLAKSLEAADIEQTGAIVGTPPYLSPEQARGEKADARSDLYALGVIMYEMLTGRRPFQSDTAAGYIDKHLREMPKPPSAWNPKLSPSLEKIVLRCLEKDSAKRFQSAADVLKALSSVGASAPRQVGPRRKLVLAAGSTLALIGLAIMAILRFGPGRTLGPAAGLGGRLSVAVMYFENQTGDQNLGYLGKNLTLQIIQALLQSRYIRVITNDRLLDILKGEKLLDRASYSTEDLRRVAAKAQVKHILHGHLSKIGNEFSINSILHDTSTWELVANEQEKGTGQESLSGMVDRIARQVKADLNLSLEQIDTDIAAPVRKITTDSQQALREYVTGKMLYYEGKIEESSQAFQKALDLDPEFAMASWGLGLADFELGQWARGKAHLKKALEAADAGRVSLREHYLIQGFYAALSSPSVQDALDLYQKLLALYPDDVEGNVFLGSLYRNIEEWDLAEERFETARRIDTYNESVYVNLIDIHMAKGLYERARDMIQANMKYMAKAYAHYYFSEVFLGQGRLDQAVVEIKKALDEEPLEPRFLIFESVCRQLQGDTAEARRVFEALLQRPDIACQLPAILYLSHLALQEGRWAAGGDLLSKGILKSRAAGFKSYEAMFLYYGAWFELQKNNPAGALQNARSILALAEEMSDVELRAQALRIQGLALIENAQGDEALRVARNLQQLAERSGNRRLGGYYHDLMGRYYLENHNIGLAEDFCSMSVAFLPSQHSDLDEHAVRYEALAEAYEANGDWTRAQKAYESITRLTYGRIQWGAVYSRSFYRLGKIYSRRSLNDKAKKAYAEFLDLWREADAGRPEVEDARRELKRLGEPPLRSTPSQNKSR
jgi:tetratricopeptide (TPR) repeat protein